MSKWKISDRNPNVLAPNLTLFLLHETDKKNWMNLLLLGALFSDSMSRALLNYMIPPSWKRVTSPRQTLGQKITQGGQVSARS